MMMSKKFTYSYTLPEDLWLDILSKLPVKSLLRCRCVCKTWHHIISTNTFVKTHIAYQNSSSNTNKYMLYNGTSLCELFTDTESLCDVTKRSKLYYTSESFGTNSVNIFGVCNGVLCLSHYNYCIPEDIYLWNPICRKIKKLPQLKLEIETLGYFELRHYTGLSFGYYDDDYKVIVISPMQKEQLRIIVCIYSLGTNSWKIICTDHYLRKKRYTYMGALSTQFLNGTAYMLTCTSRLQSVVCFSLSDETIRVVKAPQKFHRDSVNIEAYGETIAVLGLYIGSAGGFDHYLEMYTLRSNNNNNKSLFWENKFSMKLYKHSWGLKWTCPLGFLSNGKYLVRSLVWVEELSSWAVKLYWCDLDSAKLTALKLHKQYLVNGSRFYALDEARIHSNCIESLLLLNEDNVDPYVHREMEEFSCSNSVLFTLDSMDTRSNTLYDHGKKET